jgi:hypothetical protein
MRSRRASISGRIASGAINYRDGPIIARHRYRFAVLDSLDQARQVHFRFGYFIYVIIYPTSSMRLVIDR